MSQMQLEDNEGNEWKQALQSIVSFPVCTGAF